MKEMYFPEFDETLEALFCFMDSIPESRLKMVNIVKYKKMMQTAALLKNALAETEDSFEINCEVIEKFNIGSVSVELDALSINNTSKFAALINSTDCFEIYPLSNDRIRLELTFQAILKSI